MTTLRAVWRLLGLLVHLGHGLWTLHRVFPRLDATQRQQAIQSWCAGALRVAGVHLLVQGESVPSGPLLVIANHISWLDILVINAARPCRFVSKADVRHWPVIGTLVAASGTLFIERDSRRDALRVVHHMAERLQAGEVLAVFPEGTTSDGHALLPFHANLLQAAVATDAPIQPLGLAYLRGRGQAVLGEAPRHPAPAYVGEMTLLQSMWQTASARDLQATVRWGEPDTHQGRDRRTWAHALREEVARLADLPL